MKNVTIRGSPITRVASPRRKTSMGISTDALINLTKGTGTPNLGRLAIDNELVRFKYGV